MSEARVTELLGEVVDTLKVILKRSARVETNDPLLTRMAHVWTDAAQGFSLKEALALLFVGMIALKGEWEQSEAEQEEGNLLAYATIPEIQVN